MWKIICTLLLKCHWSLFQRFTWQWFSTDSGNQCWPSSMTSYRVTKIQWAKHSYPAIWSSLGFYLRPIIIYSDSVGIWLISAYTAVTLGQAHRQIQCKPDISRLAGSMERYRDISESAIYRATVMSQIQTPFSSALWTIMGPLCV